MTTQEFQNRYLPLAPRLYAVAFDLLHSAQDAEDAVQDVYLRLWPMADRIARMERPEGYFLSTLRNVCLDQMRQNRWFADPPSDDTRQSPADLAPPPDGPLEVSDRWSYLLSQLPPKARRILILRSRGDYSAGELAEITHDTEDNVRAILSRSRKKLRQCLDLDF